MHRGVTMSGRHWGCDFVARAQTMAVYVPWRCLSCFGVSQPSAREAVHRANAFEELWMWLCLPLMGLPSAPCLSFPLTPPGLGTRIMSPP